MVGFADLLKDNWQTNACVSLSVVLVVRLLNVQFLQETDTICLEVFQGRTIFANEVYAGSDVNVFFQANVHAYSFFNLTTII